ncbi:hypothetical protein BLNAU_22153 [Blattamonas nauphoetae]|uniref:Uncharacterized protein n=1 Tax=Blattamonas nauphoetae TaxID=2049346 RepID=A0ABQ9WW56_9EUKA|nr:hypothetical protein BLNAU_22153 [Blattamonas nauphoetae]
METNSNSDNTHSMQPSTRVETPLFQRIEPDTITTVDEVSPPFMSLVDFVREGNTLDDSATEQACTLLKILVRLTASFSATKRLLSQLVPSSDGSWSGFAESFVLLLTCSNETLVKAVLSLLLRFLLFMVAGKDHFFFLETGFFQLLPQSFYEQEMHISTQHGLDLMHIVTKFLYDLALEYSRRNCENWRLSMDSFQLTFLDKFIRPIEPFLVFVCNNRRRITDSVSSDAFPRLLGTIVDYSPFLEELTQLVLLSSFALTFSDSLLFFETNDLTFELLSRVLYGHEEWQDDTPAVRKRRHQIITKLSDEGLLDEIELHIRCHTRTYVGHQYVFIGAKLMHNLGGNVPFMGEAEDEWLEADLDEEWAFNWDDGRENDWDYDWGSDLGGNVPFMGAVEDERLEEEWDEESDEERD